MKTYAIIGHGNTPTGKGWGSHIDACDIVVRMWNCKWQNIKDYGKKYDYGFYEISTKELTRYHKHIAGQPVPAISWIGSVLLEEDRWHPSPNIIIYPERWESIALMMGASGQGGKRFRFTRGVRAAAWAIEQAAKGDRVVLVGFDNVRAGRALAIEEGFPAVYVNAPGTFPFRTYADAAAVKSRRYKSHDYGIEGPFLNRLAEGCGVEVVHAQDLWS